MAPYKYTYSFNIKNNNSKLSKLSSKTLNLGQKNYTNIFRNIKHKNTYIGFFNKKGKFKLQQGMFSYKLSTNSNFNNSVESNNSIERHNSSMISNKLNSINLSNKIQKEKERIKNGEYIKIKRGEILVDLKRENEPDKNGSDINSEKKENDEKSFTISNKNNNNILDKEDNNDNSEIDKKDNMSNDNINQEKTNNEIDNHS